MMKLIAVYTVVLVVWCCFGCRHLQFTEAPKAYQLIDTTVIVEGHQTLRVIKHEAINMSSDVLKLAKVRVNIENLSDSTMLLCQSYMFYAPLDSIFYISYMTDMEYSNDFLVLSPHAKVQLLERLEIGSPGEYALSYEVIPNFSIPSYERYYTIGKPFIKRKKRYIPIGITEYPATVYYLNITPFKISIERRRQ